MRKIVITYGTFDLFHVGHLNLFKKLKLYGSHLIVGVSTDEFNAVKGKKTIIPFEQRIEIVRSVRYVDDVIAEKSWDQKIDDIKNYSVDLFCIGSDWRGKFDFLTKYCDVKYLERTEGISTSQLKEVLSAIEFSKDKFVQAFDLLDQIRKQID